MRLSHSSIETYKQCPRKYKLNQIDKIPEPKGVEAVFGSYLHYVLQWFFENDYRKISLKDLLSYYETHFSEIKYFDSKSQTEKNLDNFYFDEGLLMLTNFYKPDVFKSTTIVDLELPFEITIKEPNNPNKIHIVSGIIDRIDKTGEETYEIIDYKSGKKLPSQRKVDDNNQLSIYALGFLTRWPDISLQNIRLSLYFLKFGEKIKTSRNPNDLETTKTNILKTIHDIEKDKNFRPKTSILCNWCGYKNICPAYEYKEAIDTKKPEIDVKNLMDKYFTLLDKKQKNDKELEFIKNRIDDFLTSQNIKKIETNHGFFELNDSEEYAYEWQKIRDILKPLGKWSRLVTINVKEFEKIMREIPEETREQINSYKIIKTKATIVMATNKKDLSDFKNGDCNKKSKPSNPDNILLL